MKTYNIYNGTAREINIIQGATWKRVNGLRRLVGGEVIKTIPHNKYIKTHFVKVEGGTKCDIPIQEFKVPAGWTASKWTGDELDMIILSWEYINQVAKISSEAKERITLPANAYGLGEPVWNETGDKVIGHTCLIPAWIQ